MPIVECLNCGETRSKQRDLLHRVVVDDSCDRCGYLGWAETGELDEKTRRLLRERPIFRRRLLSVT